MNMATSIVKPSIPTLEIADCTKEGNIWTSGNLRLYKRGNVVQLTGSPSLEETTERTAFALIPAGFRPASIIYTRDNVDGYYFIFNTDGTIQTGTAVPKKQRYFSAIWVVA